MYTNIYIYIYIYIYYVYIYIYMYIYIYIYIYTKAPNKDFALTCHVVYCVPVL